MGAFLLIMLLLGLLNSVGMFAAVMVGAVCYIRRRLYLRDRRRAFQ